MKEYPETVTCAYCGKTTVYDRLYKPRKYCGPECSKAADRDNTRLRRGTPDPEERSCDQCGATFLRERGPQRFCTPKCWELSRKKTPAPRPCDQCGNPYHPRNSAQKFCADACRRKAARPEATARERVKRQRRPPTPMEERQCRGCEERFTVKVTATKLWCGKTCKDRNSLARRRRGESVSRIVRVDVVFTHDGERIIYDVHHPGSRYDIPDPKKQWRPKNGLRGQSLVALDGGASLEEALTYFAGKYPKWTIRRGYYRDRGGFWRIVAADDPSVPLDLVVASSL